ncbi:hypothetical protein A6K76_06965 [Caryophanon latum]|uniref:Uncharacterized protein n=1 Tax=Caryophanon latum TaxID=33977 RepID=A0A1C0YZ57_9BACL|nr:hypothetical protein A6K76_06965 [Caryophanon latum]
MSRFYVAELVVFDSKIVHHHKLGLTLEHECCLEQEADSCGKSMSLRLQAQAMPAESLPRRGKQPQVMVNSQQNGNQRGIVLAKSVQRLKTSRRDNVNCRLNG